MEKEENLKSTKQILYPQMYSYPNMMNYYNPQFYNMQYATAIHPSYAHQPLIPYQQYQQQQQPNPSFAFSNPYQPGHFVQQTVQKQFKYKNTNPVRVMCVECNKIFDNEKMYQNHILQHVKCEFCPFAASKRIVSQHVQKEHSDQQQVLDAVSKPDAPLSTIKWIKTMDSQKDIDEWISARKKNYPTDSHIEQKKQETLSKAEEKKRFNYICNVFRKDSKLETEEKETIDYDGQDSDEAPTEESSKVKAKQIPQKSSKACKWFAKGNCKNGDRCHFQHILPSNNNQSPQLKRKRGDLYDMLSAKDNLNERDIVFQAIRYLRSIDLESIKEPEIKETESDDEASDSSEFTSSSINE